ncbi:unnamed protein product [Adineta steineri]|uniref:glutathione transferase n=1 Tax=Adineta steineri TaxID=433720 RepID=A0A814WTN6_9BILA|nr:unnamed protein product [Adineta steineri]CAF3590076.1 unnamed protein product [Adineta steineri]
MSYKLHYFNVRGYAEVSRLIFAAAGQNFEDIRYERNSEEWTKHKNEMPLGQVPVLEYDGMKLPQSKAIARFLANQFHLAGKDNFEQAKVDSIVDTLYDLVTAFIPVRMEQDETKQKELAKKFFDEELPKHLKHLETLGKMYSNGGSFFVGNQLTWADLTFYNFTDLIFQSNSDCLNNYSWLQNNRAEVEKQPKIAEYLKNRPKTM